MPVYVTPPSRRHAWTSFCLNPDFPDGKDVQDEGKRYHSPFPENPMNLDYPDSDYFRKGGEDCGIGICYVRCTRIKGVSTRAATFALGTRWICNAAVSAACMDVILSESGFSGFVGLTGCFPILRFPHPENPMNPGHPDSDEERNDVFCSWSRRIILKDCFACPWYPALIPNTCLPGENNIPKEIFQSWMKLHPIQILDQ